MEKYFNKVTETFRSHLHKNLVDLQSFHNILRLFDGSENFPFTTSGTKRDY